MPNGPVKILIVEDVATDAELAVRELRRNGLEINVRRVETRASFIAELETFTPDIILSDFSLPTFDGLSALSIAHERYSDIPFIFVSGTIGEQTAIDALRGGAIDYVLKTNLPRLGPAVRRAIEEARTRAARMQAESRFRDLIEFAPHAIVVINERGLIEIVNMQAELLFGYARSEIIGTSSESLIPRRFEQWHAELQATSDETAQVSHPGAGFEVNGRRKDGTEFPAEINLSPLKTESGLWASSVIRDISERKLQEERLARMTRIRTILGSINSIILRIRDKQRLLDEACRIAFEEGQFAGVAIGMMHSKTLTVTPVAWAGIDQIFIEQFNASANENVPEGRGIVGISLRTKHPLFSNDVQNDPRLESWHPALVSQGYQSLFVVPLIVGSEAIGVLVLTATELNVFNEEEQRLLSELAADISFALDYIAKEEQLNYLAYFDPITGLPNRSLFQDRLGQLIALEASNPLENIAVILIDLERFRHVNDSFGRNAADDLLREVARRLRACIPDPSYLARTGADSFVFAVKDNGSGTEVIHLLERELVSRLSEPMQLQGKNIHISVKAGIALFPLDGAESDTLLRNAEAALKNAKASNVRYLFYTAAMNARAAEKLSIEHRLRRALDEEQFVLHYQPKIDLATGRLAGLEALIRWNEPGVGMILPSNFIHVLEETGLILDVGNWVIARAYRQYCEWVARGMAPPRIAVNVSQLQIRQKNFVDNILHMLEPGGPGKLEIEITESLFMGDAEQEVAKSKLAALREIGITVAIDDFGTGYSSLSYIARLPIDTLKIDRSFVTGMVTSVEHMAIVSTIVSLAHSLKLTVVAEGVETQEQSNLLRNMGCDQIQGLLYNPALPPDEIEALLDLQAGQSNFSG